MATQQLRIAHRLAKVGGSWRRLHTAQRLSSAAFDGLVPQRQPFATRHIGPSAADQRLMLETVGYSVSRSQPRLRDEPDAGSLRASGRLSRRRRKNAGIV